MTAPDGVYADRDGAHYLAYFEDHHGSGGWWRWQAIAGGWAERRPCAASAADGCDELPARLADLALRLSGVPRDELCVVSCE